MAKPALIPLQKNDIEIDIFSNKSSLVLFWLLCKTSEENKFRDEGFSINELSRDIQISIGLVHKIIKQLEYTGIIKSQGLRTNKRFYIKKPQQLLVSWIKNYNLVRKTTTKGFAQADLRNISLIGSIDLVPALHTAAKEVFHSKVTNLKQKEFYLPDWLKLSKLVKQFDLVELDRGYEVLLVKPYYSALLEKYQGDQENYLWRQAFELLTILDLIHFPVRGIEQAEVLFKNSPLKSICSWKEIENAIG